jgi:hypothetical protein
MYLARGTFGMGSVMCYFGAVHKSCDFGLRIAMTALTFAFQT